MILTIHEVDSDSLQNFVLPLLPLMLLFSSKILLRERARGGAGYDTIIIYVRARVPREDFWLNFNLGKYNIVT